MKITFNPISFLGILLAWHWFGWRLALVCFLVTSEITFGFNLNDLWWELRHWWLGRSNDRRSVAK